MMDNIIIEKVYEDSDLMEMKISVKSEFVSAHQYFYTQELAIKELSDMISEYTKKFNQSYYFKSGEKEGKLTSAFSIEVLPAKMNGNLKIEVDLEIDDNNERKHRCNCYINTDIGALERFGSSLLNLIGANIGTEIELNKNFSW